MVSGQLFDSQWWARSVGACGLGLGLVTPAAFAQMDVDATDTTSRETTPDLVAEDFESDDEPKISGTFGIDYNTHFVSYGFDVWGAGTEFWEDNTLNPYVELGLDFDRFSVTAGIWFDINDNAAASIGGDIQEVDFYYGVSTGYEDFTFGVTYQHWHYGGGVEQVLDLDIGYDDSGLWGDEDFALNPSFRYHDRLASSNIGGDSNGAAFLFGIEPALDLIQSEEYPVGVSIPVTVAFGTDDFYADSGYAYLSVGAQFSVPLEFIDTAYGEWSLGAGLTFYQTDEDAIGNADDNFLTGNIGVSVGF